MTRRTSTTALALALALLGAGCDDDATGGPPLDPRPEALGRVTVELTLTRSAPYLIGEVRGELVLTSAAGEQRVPFAWDTASPPVKQTGGLSIAVADGFDCDPADGPVTVTVVLGSWIPRPTDAATPQALLGTDTREVPCQASFEHLAQLVCAVDDPRSWGQVVPAVALDPAPAGATGAFAMVEVPGGVERGRPYPAWQAVVPLTRDPATGRLVGQRHATGCQLGDVVTYLVDLVHVDFVDDAARAAWGERWPATLEVAVPCVPGAETVHETVLDGAPAD